jgi:TRAP-type C4-dicarboxylate transport system permease small subunit
MAREQRGSFWVSTFALILYTLACGAIPVYHQFSGRDLKPALTINLDSVYLFMFLLGTGAIIAIAALNRRITALEKKDAQEKLPVERAKP